jgi:putative ABC transport system permease protein
MSFFVVFIEAWRALKRHKTRSALTTLGITIGIAAVVCVVAIGSAGAERAEQQLQALGDNLVWIEAGGRNIKGVRTGTHGTTSLTLEDAEAIVREVPLLKAMSPQLDGNLTVQSQSGANWSTRWRGVAPSYLEIRRWRVALGAPFSDDDVTHSASVVLLGQTVRQQLFGALDPTGQVVRMNGQLFTVIGVLAPKGQSATGMDQDDYVMLPHTTAQQKIRGKTVAYLDDVFCSAVSAQAVNPAIDRVIPLMRERHRIRPGDEDDFNIRRPDEVIKAQLDASRDLQLFLVSIACISLLVGGIGVMNIMLVSVTERTAEIGLRMAVGARPGDIRKQFLGEAVLLCLVGGVLGVAVGVGGSYALGRALEWDVAIPPATLLVAPTFSSVVGIVFGFYPAFRASRLDPVVALRWE